MIDIYTFESWDLRGKSENKEEGIRKERKERGEWEEKRKDEILVWFNGISNTVGYLMLNTIFTYILNMICKHIFYIHTVKGSNSSISNNSI